MSSLSAYAERAEEEGDESWDLEIPPTGLFALSSPVDVADSSLAPLHPSHSGLIEATIDVEDPLALAAAQLDAEWDLDNNPEDGPDAGGDDPRTSSLDSARTDSTTDTLKGLMETLSLDGEKTSNSGGDGRGAPRASNGSPATPSSSGTSSHLEDTFGATPRQLTKPSSTSPAHLSLSPLVLHAQASQSFSSRGKVQHLGSTPLGQAQVVDDGDWDQDLEGLEGLHTLSAAGKKGQALGDDGEDGLKGVGRRGSFASHLSFDTDGGEGDRLGDEDLGSVAIATEPSSAQTPQQQPRRRISISSFSDADDADDPSQFEADFDLPATSLALAAPRLALSARTSINSLRSDASTTTAAGFATTTPERGSLRALQAHEEGGGGPTSSSATETENDDDADFFEDLVLPSYFLGSPPAPASAGLLPQTPPTSEGEPESDHHHHQRPPSSVPRSGPGSASKSLRPTSVTKVDLQSILREKLEQRGGRGLLFGPSSTTTTGSASESGSGSGASASASGAPTTLQERERLERHRERPEDEGEHAQLVLELTDATLDATASPLGSPAAPPATYPTTLTSRPVGSAPTRALTAQEMRDRMRTISGARAREAQLAQEARAAQRSTASRYLGPGLRRTASEGKVPLVGGPATTRRSSSTVTVTSLPSRANTAAPIQSTTSSARSSGRPRSSSRGTPTAQERPPSAASSRSTESAQSRRRPPPAPSAASRGRGGRSRTASLRTAASVSNLQQGARSSSSGPGGGLPSIPASPAQPERTASTLRPRRSQQHLSSTSGTSSTAPTASTSTLERRRSLQGMSNLTSPTLGAVFPPRTSTSRPPSRQGSLRSPSPSVRAPIPSYAAPTAAYANRIRERVHSLPSAPPPPSPIPNVTLSGFVRPSPLSARGTTAERHLQALRTPTARPSSSRSSSPTKPSLASAPRLPSSLTTNSMRSRAVPTHYTIPRPFPIPVRSRREYGDGTELDAFDDLPVSKERERERVVQPVSRKSSSASSATAKSGSWGRKEGVKAASSLRKTTSSSSKATENAAEKGKEKTRAGGESGSKKVKRRREPHLIRHLGGNATVKVQGEMTYNPVLQRWEGNESVLRDFDKALATSTRPALITPLSSTLLSPSKPGFSSLVGLAQADQGGGAKAGPPGASANASRATAKVVGDMVFDPITCSWHSIAGPEAEDELELDWGGGTSGGENADDEAFGASGGTTSEVDGWELGERERMLQNRASFVLEEGSEGDDDADEQSLDPDRRKKSTKRQIWRESKAAEERCRQEMRDWITRRREEGDIAAQRRWLWDLRSVAMISCFIDLPPFDAFAAHHDFTTTHDDSGLKSFLLLMFMQYCYCGQ
ncbi:hypothetical protein JCM10908_001485 [Rhodotorula pacifica]|uniref:uncharacterized protein n=1 Tax=Rhodotorula pacifica TaxID=1495444 RepID=UPI0031714A81